MSYMVRISSASHLNYDLGGGCRELPTASATLGMLGSGGLFIRTIKTVCSSMCHGPASCTVPKRFQGAVVLKCNMLIRPIKGPF